MPKLLRIYSASRKRQRDHQSLWLLLFYELACQRQGKSGKFSELFPGRSLLKSGLDDQFRHIIVTFQTIYGFNQLLDALFR